MHFSFFHLNFSPDPGGKLNADPDPQSWAVVCAGGDGRLLCRVFGEKMTSLVELCVGGDCTDEPSLF